MGIRVILLALCAVAVPGSTAATFEELAAQADAARNADHLPQAIELYRQAVQLKPAWPDGWWFLGTLFYDSDRYAEGTQAFAEFVKLQENAAPGWAFLGLCEFETGEYQHALEHIQRGLSPGSGLEPDLEQVLRFHEALLLTRLSLFDRARRQYKRLVRRGIHDPALIAGLGLNALQRPMLPREVPVGQHGVVAAAGQTAYTWTTADDPKTAAAFRALLDAYPTAPGVHYFFATYLLSSHRDQALAELQRELDENPGHVGARATMALLLLRDGLAAAALPYARKAVEDQPSNPWAQYVYALNLGDLRQAIGHLETAERIDPSNIEYHMALAGDYAKAGRYEDSRRERQTSIRLAKESEPDGP